MRGALAVKGLIPETKKKKIFRVLEKHLWGSFRKKDGNQSELEPICSILNQGDFLQHRNKELRHRNMLD